MLLKYSSFSVLKHGWKVCGCADVRQCDVRPSLEKCMRSLCLPSSPKDICAIRPAALR